jgi:hypothetical protein
MSTGRNDPQRPDEPDPGLDVDAAFAEIVAHWGATETVPDSGADPEPGSGPNTGPDDGPNPGPDDGPTGATAETAPAEAPGEAAAEPADGPPQETPRDPDALRNLFRPAFGDTLDTEASWDDEGHFVPPPPPPLPVVEPRRKLAWYALCGSPLFALLFIVTGIAMPGWVLVGMVAAFVGGFLYLVATMGSPSGDDWTGSDGAVL